MALPPYIGHALIAERLSGIFPIGTPNRNYCTRDLAASTVFTMLYVGAIEGNETWLSPLHVYRMTEQQSQKHEEADRIGYREGIKKKGYKAAGDRWYEDNTREPIRDETLRDGLIPVGAVDLDKRIPTTSGKGRYFLKKEFARLFDPTLEGEALNKAINNWREANLSKSALDRVTLASQFKKGIDERVIISLPNEESRSISPGESSVISKAVIEIFAKNFLDSPVVLWLSTSKDKTIQADIKLAASIGINIEADKNLPDIILVDIGPTDPLVVFVEVVATDGAISERKKAAYLEVVASGKFKASQIVFVTAYQDRDAGGFKKTFFDIAWNSFAWFVTEPDKIIYLKDGAIKISSLHGL